MTLEDATTEALELLLAQKYGADSVTVERTTRGDMIVVGGVDLPAEPSAVRGHACRVDRLVVLVERASRDHETTDIDLNAWLDAPKFSSAPERIRLEHMLPEGMIYPHNRKQRRAAASRSRSRR